jgi:GxxExxY protein
MNANIPEAELTGMIIQAAIEVHRTLGPGFLESIYEESLGVELRHLGLKFARQIPVTLQYRGQRVGEHRLDLVVEGKIVVELKAVSSLEPVHFAIVRSYMKAIDLSVGLLLNFAAMPLTIKRVARERSHEPPDPTHPPTADCPFPNSLNS